MKGQERGYLVIWVCELVRIFLVELGSELFVWVELQREGFCD